jgi:hypothetical protein
MKYTVTWSDDAIAVLATIWMQSPHRNAVTAAQAEIDRLLATDPRRHGAIVSEGLYAIDVHPLWAQFEVSDGDRIVNVVSVRELP